jgi:hypothetical protein
MAGSMTELESASTFINVKAVDEKCILSRKNRFCERLQTILFCYIMIIVHVLFHHDYYYVLSVDRLTVKSSILILNDHKINQ